MFNVWNVVFDISRMALHALQCIHAWPSVKFEDLLRSILHAKQIVLTI